ncbi:hypothetical protein EAI_15233 [Harpegnathos saltator]|uniref:Osiris 6 n=1 Tax=Harpegnathos saltator TaxID=610380 RepID=E2B2W5_HARSA|nr:hypothetical protein EAI_15233 [Harpegnathos saltator]
MKKTSAVVVTLLTTALVLAAGQTIDECLKQDSISCVQNSLYRSAKDFFGKQQLDLVTGVSLVKNKDDARSARSGKELAHDQEMDAATGVAERQDALENFIGDEVGQFLTGRSLRINLASAFEKVSGSVRAFSESVPPEIRQAVDEVVEGRKRKKMRRILPLLIAAKIKMGLLATLTYFVAGLLAKKAIFASLISLAISAFVGMKSLWGVVSNSGWSSGGGWEDPHAHGQVHPTYHH